MRKIINTKKSKLYVGLASNHAITLISLVVTIVIIIILAGVVISFSLGENGIFARAKETKRLQIIAEVKEQIGTEILSAQVDAFARNEELEQSQVEDIVSKYGELQEDKDTIILKDNGYEISLLEIYNGTATETGSYTDNKAKIELLEKQVAELQKMLEDSSIGETIKLIKDQNVTWGTASTVLPETPKKIIIFISQYGLDGHGGCSVYDVENDKKLVPGTNVAGEIESFDKNTNTLTYRFEHGQRNLHLVYVIKFYTGLTLNKNYTQGVLSVYGYQRNVVQSTN